MADDYSSFSDCVESFDGTFGRYKYTDNESALKSKITTIDDGRAHPCNKCGCYPRITNIAFKDEEAHPKHFLIDCDTCLSCCDEWYASEEDAIAAWNEKNPLVEVPVDEQEVIQKKFAEEVVGNCKF